MKTGLTVIVLAMLGIAFAQNAPPAPRGSLLQLARKGDDSALYEMEQSGDIQDLQALLHDPDYSAKTAARIFLAKMGDHEALQYFACRSLDNWSALDQDLDQIGGEFRIELYRRLLDSSDQTFFANIRKEDRSSDELLTPPSSIVLLRLPALLPDAGIPKPAPLDIQAGRDKEFKSRWREWIDSHQSELQQLKPTAEGISFDPHSCSNIYDPTAMNRRLQTISGAGGVDCRAPAAGDAGAVSNCIRTSFAKKRPFYVRQDLYGTDSGVAVGLAGDGKGNAYAVAYDDTGVSTTGLGEKVELFDNKHTAVVSCPKPIRFRLSMSWNGLTCLTKKGNLLLSPH